MDSSAIELALRSTGEELAADGSVTLRDPNPLPLVLSRAVARVARDFAMAEDWLNAVVGRQFGRGFPPGLENELTWRTYAGLEVGFVGRRALIALKLFAAVDNSPQSVHTQDLIALAPNDTELHDAAIWVASQDASPHFTELMTGVIQYVQDRNR